MTDRAFNFAAGPAILPLPVLERARQDIVSLPGVGASPLEVGHRSPWFTSVIEETGSNLRDLLGVPDGYHVVFCQGGASLQFSMVAMNLLRGTEGTAEYAITGSWGSKAIAEARKEGTTRIAWTGADEGFVRVPGTELLESIGSAPAYVHVTSNETIQGVEFPATPIVPDDVPLVADVSSDFLSRPIDVARYGSCTRALRRTRGRPASPSSSSGTTCSIASRTASLRPLTTGPTSSTAPATTPRRSSRSTS